MLPSKGNDVSASTHTKKNIIETSPFEWAIRATIFSEATPMLMSDTAMNACFARQTQCRWRFYLTAMMQPHFNFTPQHVHTTICRWHTTNRTSAVEWQFNNKQRAEHLTNVGATRQTQRVHMFWGGKCETVQKHVTREAMFIQFGQIRKIEQPHCRG